MVIERRLEYRYICLGVEMELLSDFGNDQSEEGTLTAYESESVNC